MSNVEDMVIKERNKRHTPRISKLSIIFGMVSLNGWGLNSMMGGWYCKNQRGKRETPQRSATYGLGHENSKG